MGRNSCSPRVSRNSISSGGFRIHSDVELADRLARHSEMLAVAVIPTVEAAVDTAEAAPTVRPAATTAVTVAIVVDFPRLRASSSQQPAQNAARPRKSRSTQPQANQCTAAIASRLARLHRPGTTCIRSSFRRQSINLGSEWLFATTRSHLSFVQYHMPDVESEL